MKRYLYFTHRWLGIMLCLFMSMWFLSGIVMMYVGYPKLTATERLAALPKLDGTQCCVELSTVFLTTGEQTSPESIRLTTVSGSPRFILNYSKTKVVAVNGITGRQIANTSASEAVLAAQSFMSTAGEYIDQTNEDAWTHSLTLIGWTAASSSCANARRK